MASLFGVPAEDWSAIATWCAVALAAGAALVARHQLEETRRLRRQQAQPYVVAYIEASYPGSFLFDLVIKNLGQIAARNIMVRISPEARRAIDRDEPDRGLRIPDPIPVLVPGQEWRTIWDSGIARDKSGLPDRHVALVSFSDDDGRPFTFEYVLDWGVLWSREMVTVRGTHDAASALRDISKTMKDWREGVRGLSVVVRDGDAKDERTREVMAERRRRQEEQAAVESPPDAK